MQYRDLAEHIVMYYDNDSEKDFETASDWVEDLLEDYFRFKEDKEDKE